MSIYDKIKVEIFKDLQVEVDIKAMQHLLGQAILQIHISRKPAREEFKSI